MANYTEDEIKDLMESARKSGLRAPDEFWATPPKELVKICNGIGADWQSERTRKIVTKALRYAEEAALIHDWEYSQVDGSKTAQRLADERFLINGLKLADVKYPFLLDWRRWLAERAVLAMHAVLKRLGWVQCCIDFTEKTNEMRGVR